jgi:hypothetical protein
VGRGEGVAHVTVGVCARACACPTDRPPFSSRHPPPLPPFLLPPPPCLPVVACCVVCLTLCCVSHPVLCVSRCVVCLTLCCVSHAVLCVLRWWLQLDAYVGTFDLRDPGNYTLQVVVGEYLGDSEPGGPTLPITVGSHRHLFGHCNLVRALPEAGR